MKKALLVFFLTAAAGALFMVLLWQTAIFDDAYITFRYARNIARGLGAVFNAGEKVEGCTAFLQMMILVPFAARGINLGHVSVAISILCLALIAAMGYRRIAREPSSPYNSAWAWFYAVLCATNPALVHWVLSGMETIWFAAALFAAVLLTEREMDKGRLPFASAAVCVVAALIRPEGTVLAFALMLSWILFYAENRFKPAAVLAAVFGAAYGVYFLWRFSYYGYFFPNTYYVKVGAINPLLVARGIVYFFRAMIAGLFPLAVILLLIISYALRIPLQRWEKTALTVIGAQCMQTIAAGGDFMPYFRFLLPEWPLFVLLTWSRLGMVERNRAARGKKPLRLVAKLSTGRWRIPAILGCLFLINGLMMLLDKNEAKVIAGTQLTRNMEKAARRVNEAVPRDSLIAATAIGAMGYISDRPLIDVLGLTDEHIAHADITTGPGVAGHEKYDTDYVLSRRPEFILSCVEMGKKPKKDCPHEGRRHAVTALLKLLESREFRKQYYFYSHKTKNGYLSTYMRRDLLNQPGYEGWFYPWQKEEESRSVEGRFNKLEKLPQTGKEKEDAAEATPSD